jgi:hypothetical protein
MKIYCHDAASFYESIADLTQRQLGFEACTRTLIITLTGGY